MRTAAERFFTRIATNAPGGCWLWTGSKGSHGYGNLKSDDGVRKLTSRWCCQETSLRRRRLWRARVEHAGRAIHLGTFDTIAAASAAVTAKRLELFTHNDADRGRGIEVAS